MLGDLKDELLTNGGKLSTIVSMNQPPPIYRQAYPCDPQSATLLEVIVTNTRDTVIHRTSFQMLSPTMNLFPQRST